MKWLNLKHPYSITAVLIIIPVLVFAVTDWLQNKYEKLPVYNFSVPGQKEKVKHVVQPFSLHNQSGNSFSDKNIDNKIYVADFFFTSCTSICPIMTGNLKLVQDAFKNDTTIALVSFSVDPETDTAQRLKWYADVFKIDTLKWNLLTGSKREIYRLARESFYVSATDGDGGPNDFIHSDNLVLVDKQKQIRGYYTGTDKTSVEQLIDDIKKLKNEN
jgi:protein SCO1/2